MVETLKVNASPSTHEELDGVLSAFMRDEFGKHKLKTELLRVAGRNACHRALLALRPLLKTLFQEGKGRIIKRKPLATLPTKPLAEPLAKPLTRQAARQAARAKPSAKPLAKPPAETDLPVWRGKYLAFGKHSMNRDDFLKWDCGIMGIVGSMGSGG